MRDKWQQNYIQGGFEEALIRFLLILHQSFRWFTSGSEPSSSASLPLDLNLSAAAAILLYCLMHYTWHRVQLCSTVRVIRTPTLEWTVERDLVVNWVSQTTRIMMIKQCDISLQFPNTTASMPPLMRTRIRMMRILHNFHMSSHHRTHPHWRSTDTLSCLIELRTFTIFIY